MLLSCHAFAVRQESILVLHALLDALFEASKIISASL